MVVYKVDRLTRSLADFEETTSSSVLVRVVVENHSSAYPAVNALRLTLPDYLLVSPENASPAKFIADRYRQHE
jgi:hypothetical protein